MNRLRIISLLMAMIMVVCCFSGCSHIGQIVDRILDNTRNPLQDIEETLPTDTTEEAQPASEPEVPETTGSTEATEPAETEPEITTGPVGMGITSGDYVNVRSGPGIQYEISQTIRKNTRLEVLEIQDNWCRTSIGWIYQDYVYIDGTYAKDPAIMGTIKGTDVNIRSGPGMDCEIVGSTNTGDRYEFYYQTIIGGRKWGCTSIGWICMDYVTLDGNPAVSQPGPTVPKQ